MISRILLFFKLIRSGWLSLFKLFISLWSTLVERSISNRSIPLDKSTVYLDPTLLSALRSRLFTDIISIITRIYYKIVLLCGINDWMLIILHHYDSYVVTTVPCCDVDLGRTISNYMHCSYIPTPIKCVTNVPGLFIFSFAHAASSVV